MIKMLLNIFKLTEKETKYRKTLKELQALTDYELRDIGLTRGEIYSVARGSF